jgi:hydrogenase maturation protease
MKEEERSILIMGFGSEALMDDGIPIRLIEDLKSLLTLSGITLSTSALGGLEIPELLKGYKVAVLIDTIKTAKGIPGDVYSFTQEHFIETYHLSSNHDVSFYNALKLGNSLGFHMPKKIIIIAIEIAENQILDYSLSPDLEKRYQEILTKIKEICLALPYGDEEPS